MIAMLLAQDAPSFRLQVWALVIAALAAVMPIAVAIVISALARKQALRDLRNKELVRVHEELIEGISAFGVAALRQNLLFEHHIALQAKCAVARIHAGPDTTQCLQGIENWAARVFALSRTAITAIQEGGDGRAEQQALLEEAGKMLAIVEILADNVTIQLGPTYGESHSWWQDLKVGVLYAFFKAKERMLQDWQKDQKRAKRQQKRRNSQDKLKEPD
jgi:hypothetical protein